MKNLASVITKLKSAETDLGDWMKELASEDPNATPYPHEARRRLERCIEILEMVAEAHE